MKRKMDRLLSSKMLLEYVEIALIILALIFEYILAWTKGNVAWRHFPKRYILH